MELKEQIVKTGCELFLKFGLRRVTITEICGELRISKKTFYTIFKQKEELIKEVLQNHHTHYEFFIDEKLSFRENLEKRARLVLNETQMEKHANFFFDLEKYYPDMMKFHSQLIKQNIRFDLETLCNIGMKENLIREGVNFDFLTCIIYNGIALHTNYIKNETGFTHKKLAFHILDVFIRLVCKPEIIHKYEEEIKLIKAK